MRGQTIELIHRIATESGAFDLLEKSLTSMTKKQIQKNILSCGIMPESFGHDSSEEKLWSKYSDIMLSTSLNQLGMKAYVLGTRGNSADVFAEAKGYKIVGDAKTFRLTRTAKNQKDFKVSALASWRKESNYAFLVCPLYQYPKRASQIYAQAIDKNVTLLSYVHLLFLLDNYKGQSLKPIWETGDRLRSAHRPPEHDKAELYWRALDESVVYAVGGNLADILKCKQLEIEKTKEISKEGIAFWKDEREKCMSFSRKEAITQLIIARQIDTKIRALENVLNYELSNE